MEVHKSFLKELKTPAILNIFSVNLVVVFFTSHSIKDHKTTDSKLYKRNALMVGFGSFQNKKFVRLVIVNCENSFDDVIRFFKVLEEFSDNNSNLIKRSS